MSGTSKALSIVGAVFNIIGALVFVILALVFFGGNSFVADNFNAAEGGEVTNEGDPTILLTTAIIFVVLAVVFAAGAVTKFLSIGSIGGTPLTIVALVLSILTVDILGTIGVIFALVDNSPGK